MDYQPIVIIGAPRSGTNMLRDVLTNLPNVSTWPCDEINYVWRHGNVFFPSDEIPSCRATPRIARYVRRQFGWVAKKYGADYVVEKTCANSLRIDFVNKIVPDAKYIVIRRNGIDAAASALKKWTAKAHFGYIARKAYCAPWMDLPVYLVIRLRDRLGKAVPKEADFSMWGPIIADMDEIMMEYSLPEVCMIQWKRCVELADEGLDRVSPNKVYEIAYETFVRTPLSEIYKLSEFLELPATEEVLARAVTAVTSESIGKGRESLNNRTLERMLNHASGTLGKYGYA